MLGAYLRQRLGTMDSTLVRGRLANIIIDIGHNFEQFWVFLGRELWPVKGRRYFEASLELVLSIAADHRKARSIQLIYVLLAMSAALAIVQCLNTQPTFMLLTFDYFGYNQQASNIKIFKAMINITAFHYYKIFYIRFGKMKEFKNHIRVITHDDRTLLPDSSFDFWQLILWCLRFYQVMVVGFEMILIGCYLKFCVALWCASFGPLSYLSMSIGFVLFSATILLVCVGGFAASLTVYSIKALFERLHFQSRRYLHRRINRLTPVRLLQHRRVNAQTMRLQFALSPIYGQVLLTFLWTNLPLNVYLVTMLILNSMPDKNFFYFSIVAILGELCLWAVSKKKLK